MARVAMIGATGLIGRDLAPLLVAAGHRLTIVGRRPARVTGADERVAPIAQWPQALADWRGDVAISTLGTTRKQAGSWEAFRAVDLDAVVAFAGAAKAGGARQFISVSSVGADPRSRNPYLAMKGEIERALAAIGFERLDIIRPGLLRGERGGPRRVGESIGIRLSPLLNPILRGRLDRFQAIDSTIVARAMARLVGDVAPGRHVHLNRDLRAVAGQR